MCLDDLLLVNSNKVLNRLRESVSGESPKNRICSLQLPKRFHIRRNTERIKVPNNENCVVNINGQSVISEVGYVIVPVLNIPIYKMCSCRMLCCSYFDKNRDKIHRFMHFCDETFVH